MRTIEKQIYMFYLFYDFYYFILVAGLQGALLGQPERRNHFVHFIRCAWASE